MIGWVLLAVALSLILLGAMRWWIYTVDDSYISLRYAHHVAIGAGPVFNLGEQVEGYSCPAWVFALALIERLGGDPLLAAKCLGLLCALALVALLHGALLRSAVDPVVAGLAALWLAVQPGLHFYAVSGMETLAFALAVALAMMIPLWTLRRHALTVAAALCLLGVATLRPEGLLVFVGLGAIVSWRGSGAARRGVLLAGIAVGGLLLARHAFYDAWLPNTYLAKPSPLLHFMREHAALQSLQALAGSLRSNPALYSPLREMGGLALAIGVAGAFMAARGARLFWPAVTASAVGLAFLAYAPPDWMPAGRFAIPFAFPLVYLAALGASAGLRRVPAVFARGFSTALVLAIVVASGFRLIAIESFLGSMRQGELNSALDARPYAEIGRWLAAHAAPSERVLAYEVGAVGYFSRLPIIDHEGLVTEPVARVIGRTGGYGDVRLGRDRQALAEVVQYCARQQPEWFMLRVLASEPPVLGSRVPEAIAREPIQNALLHEVGADMVVAATFPMSAASGQRREWYVLLHRVGETPS